MDFSTFMGATVLYREQIKNQLQNRVTGKIYTDYLVLKDCTIVTISNRGFMFEYKLYKTSEKMNKGVTSSMVADEICKSYKYQIIRTFFKSS